MESPVPSHSISSPLVSETVLEGYMLKQGSRSFKLWHERYFVFRADNTLVYYNHRGETNAKAAFVLSKLPQCEISDLYVDQHHKNLIYCVRISWVSGSTSSAAPSDYDDDEDEYLVGATGSADDLTGGGGDAGHGPGDDASSIGGGSQLPWKISSGDDLSLTSPPLQHQTSSASQSQKGSHHHHVRHSSAGDLLRAAKSPFRRISKRNKGAESKPTRSDSHHQQQHQQAINSNPDAGAGSARSLIYPLGVPPSRSVDGESVSFGATTVPTGRPSAALKAPKQQQQQQQQLPKGPPGTRSRDNHHHHKVEGLGMSLVGNAAHGDTPEIPSMVEVDKRHVLVGSSRGHVHGQSSHPQQHHHHHQHSRQDPALNHTNAGGTGGRLKSRYDEEQEEEQQYLRTQFLENKKRSNRRIAQGTKLAAAAGATVGVAVVTAGIGLVAGLVMLAAGAAAGGGGAAVENWRRKDRGELVIACIDYEVAKQWKSCLDAALESDEVQRSTWGQLFASDGRKTRVALLPQSRDMLPSLERNLMIRNGEYRSRGPGTTGMNGGAGGSPQAKAVWRPLEGGWASFLGTGVQGLRIFREEMNHPIDHGTTLMTTLTTSETSRRRPVSEVSVDGKPCPPMKAHAVLSASPLDAFLCLMSFGQQPRRPQKQNLSTASPHTDLRLSFRIVENIDDHADVIHLMFKPLYLFPSWTTPRDFVLYRYWRLEQDGSYIVCYESVQHSECPPLSDFVRSEMHQVYTIAPLKKTHRRAAGKVNPRECFMTAVVQIDPKGWVPTTPISILSRQSYGEAFGVAALLHVLDIRDAIDKDRFLPVALDNDIPEFARSSSFEMLDSPARVVIARDLSIDSGDDLMQEGVGEHLINEDTANYDFAYSSHESLIVSASATGLTTRPPQLSPRAWAEPDSNSFRVRGKTYKHDNHKINAGPSIGRLIAVDVVLVDKPIYSGFTTHPTERIQLALEREAALNAKGIETDMPPFIFVVNIVLPGPPFYHGVFYYAVDDISTIDGSDGTPSSKLCNEFFFGPSDEFRDQTFKLIPQIVEGNFIVRKAVGSTPAIMGKKLRQLYVRSDRFLEVVLDCGSSPVATGVIRLSLGYAKTLVVDMGFLLEGDDETTLPERIFGCVRIKHIQFGPKLRKVIAPSSLSSDP